MDYAALYDQYRKLIEDDFIPFWSAYADEEYGGILNCLTNDGSEKLSDEKFTWSQGRWLWVVSVASRLHREGLLPGLDGDRIGRWMEGTFSFIKEHAFMDGWRCCYLLSREGSHLIDPVSGKYDASIYADCFVLIGVSEYIRATGKKEECVIADRLAESIISRVRSGVYNTEPYPIPAGYRVHGVPMILINTIDEYAVMKGAVGEDASEAVAYGRECLDAILDGLYDSGRKLIREHASADDRRSRYLLDRHINPGHTIEDAWFWVEFLSHFGSLDGRIDRIAAIAKSVFRLGWDEEHGGLLRFVDMDGGAPKGSSTGSRYESLILDTWDMKLWWPHSEVLYTYPLLYSLTGDEEFAEIYRKGADYAFSVFPDKVHGEWIQIRMRDGRPEEKVVALPVKDPFHILRDFMKVLELSYRMKEAGNA